MQQPDFLKIAKAHLQKKRKNDEEWIYRKEQKKKSNQQHFNRNTNSVGNSTKIDERENLPIHYGRMPLIKEVLKNPTTIVMSETGSGKTTQLPQYLLSTYLPSKGNSFTLDIQYIPNNVVSNKKLTSFY